mgnify:CR=1 FL=1
MATQQTLVGMGGVSALYDFGSGTVTFTANGRVNYTGPSLSEVRSGLSGGNSGVWKNDTNFLNTSSGFILWTVPADGTYRFNTHGCRGGNQYSNEQGGYGTHMRGDFVLVKGDVIKMLVAQQGGSSYGGGGGMSAVATNSNTPMIVSGGGNPTSPWNNTTRNATTNSSGTSGSYGWEGGSGAGGYSQAGVWGGAGFYGNPGGSESCGSTKPVSFINGGLGGYSCNGQGGWGGGSGTDGCCYGASGAGGGYSGGAGTASSGQYGGGGGSYNNGANQSNTQSGETYGKIQIEFLGA